MPASHRPPCRCSPCMRLQVYRQRPGGKFEWCNRFCAQKKNWTDRHPRGSSSVQQASRCAIVCSAKLAGSLNSTRRSRIANRVTCSKPSSLRAFGFGILQVKIAQALARQDQKVGYSRWPLVQLREFSRGVEGAHTPTQDTSSALPRHGKAAALRRAGGTRANFFASPQQRC